ncbi:MAG TPA: LamG-like jellyroll fold domain-containing protein, partial [Armatimonadota bacterium]|nr:LamG-like jellyroll fold domain-containing protein [Armatimonadota bacterium]
GSNSGINSEAKSKAVTTFGTPTLCTEIADYTPGGQVANYINGSLANTTTAPAATPKVPSARAYIGARQAPCDGSGLSRFYNGDIAEMILYDRPLSTDDRLVVEKYLKTKYGL